jgi:hypothetical protein
LHGEKISKDITYDCNEVKHKNSRIDKFFKRSTLLHGNSLEIMLPMFVIYLSYRITRLYQYKKGLITISVVL